MFKKITRGKLREFLATKKNWDTLEILDIGGERDFYKEYFPNSHKITLNIDPKRKPDVVGDAHDLSQFKENQFDLVLMIAVMEHLKDPEKVVREVKRVLKPGGKFIFTTVFIFPIHDAPGDYWRFTYFGLKELLERNGFIADIKPDFNSFSTIGVLFQRIAFQTDFIFLNKPIKMGLFLLAEIFRRLDGLIERQYGDIKKSKPSVEIMSSGYNVVAYLETDR